MNPTDIQPQPALKKTKAKPVLFSLLILLSGIIIGTGATLIVVGQSGVTDKPPLPEEFSRRMVDHLTRELHLTPEQQRQIHPIIEKHMKVMDEIRNEARPKIRQELEEMNDELMAVFDNTQQQIWKERIQRMQQRFPGMRQHHGPGERRPDEQSPRLEGPQPRRFPERIPNRIPLPPDERPPLEVPGPLPPPESDPPPVDEQL